jgi:hypothetical protein
VYSQTGQLQSEKGISLLFTNFKISFSLKYANGLIKEISQRDILFTGGIIFNFLH